MQPIKEELGVTTTTTYTTIRSKANNQCKFHRLKETKRGTYVINGAIGEMKRTTVN